MHSLKKKTIKIGTLNKLSNYYVQGNVKNINSFNPKTNCKDWCFIIPHFRSKELKAQRGGKPCL